MSDIITNFFQDCEDETVSNDSSSVESIPFPSLTDCSSDCTSLESMSIESLAWSKSIESLFENLIGPTINSFTENCGPVQIQRNDSASNGVHLANVLCGSKRNFEHASTYDHRTENESLSNSLGEESTFCLEETMLEEERIMVADDELQSPDDLGGNKGYEGTEVITTFKKQRTTMGHGCTKKIDSNVDTVTSSNGYPFKSATKGHKIASSENIFPEDRNSNMLTLDEGNIEQMYDHMRDSGIGDTLEDIVGESTQTSEMSERHRQIQDRITSLLQQIEQSVSEGIPLAVRKKPTWQSCSMENGILQSNSLVKAKKIIKPIESRRLQLMVRLLASIYQLLATGTSCTKRELYYLHLELAKSPSYTYTVLDDVCALLDAEAWEVNVFNTSKGLIAGPLVLTLSCGRTVDCNSRWGTSVPLDVGSVVGLRVSAKLVLVVEKDTVFKRLLEDGILNKFSEQLLLITGKGYPDVSTRLLLKKIADSANIPICGLMDADPHGIEILCVYKYGSLSMACQQQSLAVPRMRWIGLFPSDIELLGLQCVQLRETELKKIEHMIKRPYTEGILQRELIFQRQIAAKAEIESLYDIASDFITTVYLTQKLKELGR